MSERALAAFVRRNIGHLARACWLASAWQGSNADSEKDYNPGLAHACLRDQRRMLGLEKTLRRYMANAANQGLAPQGDNRE
jgi:hypothetical protein